MRRRVVLYAMLALAVPIPALALTGDDGQGKADASLSMSATLDSCGTAANTIACKIDATWNEIPDATRYAATITRPDGSVVDYGDVGPTGTSFWVSYVGNGTYTVTVSAYGDATRDAAKRTILDRDSSASKAEDEATPKRTGTENTDAVQAPAEDAQEPRPAPEPVDSGCDEPEPDEQGSGDAGAKADEPAPDTQSATDLDARTQLAECPAAG